jgi:hypothetical protein
VESFLAPLSVFLLSVKHPVKVRLAEKSNPANRTKAKIDLVIADRFIPRSLLPVGHSEDREGYSPSSDPREKIYFRDPAKPCRRTETGKWRLKRAEIFKPNAFSAFREPAVVDAGVF